MQRVEAVKQPGPWTSLSILLCAEDGDWETVGTVKQSRDYGWGVFSLVTITSVFSLVVKLGIMKFCLERQYQYTPQNNRIFNQGILHGLWQEQHFLWRRRTRETNWKWIHPRWVDFNRRYCIEIYILYGIMTIYWICIPWPLEALRALFA